MSVIAYTIALCAWYWLRLQYGDAIAWLAVANAFALYLFAPLILLTPLVLAARRFMLLPILLVPLALFLALFGTAFLFHPSRHQQGQPTLRVMTFNVLGNSDHPDLAAPLIESENPDVVIIQELSPQHSYALTSRLGDRYPYRLLEPMYGRRGTGILSRFPIESGTRLKLGADPFAGQQLVIDWNGQKINVINVHLESTMPGEAVTQSFRERETQIKELLELVSDSPIPSVVAGDFNMTDTTQGYASLARELKDAHRDAGWGLGLTFPANPEFLRDVASPALARLLRTRTRSVSPFLRSLYIPPLPLLRIDYIFTSPDLVATNAYAAAWDGQSDHRAVIADLQLQSP